MTPPDRPDASRQETIYGQALDAKAGAVVRTAEGEVVYVIGLASWPEALAAKRVAVTGVRARRKHIPDPVVDPHGARSQGAVGEQDVIDRATYRLAQ